MKRSEKGGAVFFLPGVSPGKTGTLKNQKYQVPSGRKNSIAKSSKFSKSYLHIFIFKIGKLLKMITLTITCVTIRYYNSLLLYTIFWSNFIRTPLK